MTALVSVAASFWGKALCEYPAFFGVEAMTIKIDVYLLWELFLLVTGLWVIRTAWFIGKLAVGRFSRTFRINTRA